MKPAIPPCFPCRSAPSRNGFTLVELLLVSLLGGMVLAGTASLVVSHIRATATQISIQQRRTEWRKFTYLLATEVGEGDRIEAGGNMSGVGSCPARTALFNVRVPLFTQGGFGGPAAFTSTIYYYSMSTDGTGVSRCGLPVRADGSLDSTRLPAPSELITDVTVNANVTNNTVVTITPSLPATGGPVQEAVTEFAVSTRTGRIN